MIARRFRWLVLALCLAFAAPVSAQQPQLQSEGVIFAVTLMRVGQAQQYVLLPVASNQVRPDAPMTSSIPTAFGILRAAKPSVYGNSSIRFTDQDAARGVVVVNIDPGRSANFEPIAAETIFTFTQLGATGVDFPGFTDSPIGRDTVQYTTWRAQVPMWQALLAGRVYESDVRLPDGDLVDSGDFYTRLEDGDSSLQRLVLDIIEGDDPTPQFAMLGVIADLDIGGYESSVVPILTHEDPNFRGAALQALVASDDAEAWDAIVEMMTTDPVIDLQHAAAQAVAVAPREDVRLYEVFYRAETMEPQIRLAAIAEAAAIDDDRVDDRLVTWLADADPAVAEASVDALTTRESWDALTTAMNDEALPDGVRLAAASSLASNADGEDRLAGLTYRGFAMAGDPALAVIDEINAMTSPDTRTTIEDFLGHPDPLLQIRAAEHLGARANRSSLDPLEEAYASEDLDVQAAVRDAAFEVVRGQDYASINQWAVGRNTFRKAAAFRALAALAQEGTGGNSVFNTLVTGLTDSAAEIRAASVTSLALYVNQEALDAILTVSEDPEPSVQAAVALALGSFTDDAYADTVNPLVTGYVASGDPEIMAGGIEALGMLGQTAMLPAVLPQIQYPDPRVRAAAMRAAAALADPANPGSVVNSIGGQLRDESVANRVLAAQLLGDFGNDAAILLLTQVVNDPVEEVRYAAISALGQTGERGAGMVLVGLIEDPTRDIRLAAIEALRTLNLRSMVPDLDAVASREQDAVTLEALQALIAELNASGV